MSNRSRAQAKRRAYTSAMSVADDIAQGRLDAAELEAEATTACRELFGRVVGEGDALWELHVDIAKQVLALDGVPFNELTEWVAVHRDRNRGKDQPAGAADVPGGAESSAYAPHRDESGGVDDAALPELDPAPQPEPDVNPYGDARRIVARGRGGPADNGLRPM